MNMQAPTAEGPIAVRQTPIRGSPSTLTDDSGDLCDRCASIDMEKLASRPVKRVQGDFVTDLDTTESLAGSACPLCRLFASISPRQEINRQDPVYLRSFSARIEFAGKEMKDLTDEGCILLGVVTFSDAAVNDENEYNHSDATLRLVAAVRESGLLSIRKLTATPNPSGFSVRHIDAAHFDLDLARSWRDYCRSKHTKFCTTPKQNRPGKMRFIDCQTRKLVQPSEWVDYAALSYVWGAPDPQFDKPILADAVLNLPKTIRDSLDVAMELGLHYLWVDRYCIDQTDPEDKLDQIQQMDAIYTCAEMTIIAAAGAGPHYGLPGINGTPRTPQQALLLHDNLVLQVHPHPNTSLSNSIWATRGWTYQEGLLSRRRLVFTSTQVLFECDSMHTRETLLTPLNKLHISSLQRFNSAVVSGSFSAKRPGASPLSFMQHVAEYYQRTLSYPSDTLNAMQGIFESFLTQPSKRRVHSISGIPIPPCEIQRFKPESRTHMFLVNLLWCHNRPGSRKPSFPSWTWAGWTGGSLASEMFVNNLKAPSRLHWQTKVWVEGSVKEDVVLFEDMPAGWVTYGSVRYVHIQARTLACELIHLDAPDVPAGDASPGLYAKMELNYNTTGYVRIFPSSFPSSAPVPSYRAIILPFALAALPSNTYFDVVDGIASILVVRDMGDWWERVGVGFVCTRVLGFEGEVVGDVAFFGVEEGEEGDESDGEGDKLGGDGSEVDGGVFVDVRKEWIGMKRFLEMGKAWREEDGDGDGDEDEDDVKDSGHRERRFVELGKGWMEDVEWDVRTIRLG